MSQTTAITLPILPVPLSMVFDGRTDVYIGVFLFLFLIISVMLLRFYERTRSGRAQRQMEQIRNVVFSKVIHEFQTPLTIILGLSKQLREQKYLSGNESLTYLNAIERQGGYLSVLVNQLVDISNLCMDGKTLVWKTGNIVAFVEMVSETFRLYAVQKEVELYFFSVEKLIEVDFVPDCLNKVLYSLLSNAVNYSEKGSRVYLILEKNKKNDNKLIIKVIDYGVGIKKEMLPHLFELPDEEPPAGSETNIGKRADLTLTKQLTESMGGAIQVESEEGKGSTFIVELPVRRNEKKLFPDWKPEKNASPSLANTPEKEDKEHFFFSETTEKDHRTTILLAEGNKDIALYIRSIFHQDRYKILYASNGEKAWDMMNRHPPDIVITDVIVTRKSGIELCKEMKASPVLNHIPVFIISSKNSEADLIEGLKSGADYYIQKPFHPEGLQVRVENLLETRRLLKEKYRRALFSEKEAESGDNEHTDFLRRVTDIIYREIKNTDFTPAKLAEEMAISVSQLNKKLNVATGYPASVYILQVKLDHAKKIFSTQNKNIGEVAAECGICDVNYFSRVFKKYNGITPTQFKRLPPATDSLNSVVN